MTRIACFILCLASLAACGGSPPETTEEPQSQSSHGMPDDEIHAGLAEGGGDPQAAEPGMMAGSHEMQLNTQVNLDPAIRDSWLGAVVEVTGPDGTAARYHLPYGQSTALGDTGLTAEALLFVPDFVMDEGGITSRSAEPANPALRVRITEDGREPYEGWLFGAMPEIHPFPHEEYSVVLVEGLSNTT